MRLYKLLLIFSLMIFLTSTLSPVQAQDKTPTKVPDEPTYAANGPYVVGRTWLQIKKTGEKPFTVVVWYPASGDEEKITLPAEYDFSNAKAVDIGYRTAAKKNAMPNNSNEPYPLLIFSPGFDTQPLTYLDLVEHLASYGFIVMASITTDIDLWSGFIIRPTEITQAIDFAETLNGVEGSFKGLLDISHIGVVGHSLGGYAALAVAGAQIDFGSAQKWCQNNTSSQAASNLCPELLPHKKDMLALAKLDSVPIGLWPSWRNPHVSAIVAQAGIGSVFGASGLAPVSIPVMLQFGSNDQIVGTDWAGYQTYKSISSQEKAEVVFENGNHAMFAQGGGDVVPDVWKLGVAHDLINHFTTAFLLDTLKADPDAHKALLPESVNFTDITYETTTK